MEPPVPRANYTSDDDFLILEDESGRVPLTCGVTAAAAMAAAAAADGVEEVDADPAATAAANAAAVAAWQRTVDTLVTGVVVAVRGIVLESGGWGVGKGTWVAIGYFHATGQAGGCCVCVWILAGRCGWRRRYE